jgi:hypothetical protein
MSVARLLPIAALAILVASPALAQKPAPPDLSCTWVLSASKSKLPKNAVPDPETLVITCASDRIEFAISAAGKQQVTAWTADGKEHTRNTSGNVEIYASARWKKGVPFTESGVRGLIGGAMDTLDLAKDRERRSLSTDGRTLTREFEGAKQTFVYDRQ